MRIDVGGRRDLGVSESFHHDPQRYALSEQERRAGVAEVVETVVSDPCLRETTLELAGYGVRSPVTGLSYARRRGFAWSGLVHSRVRCTDGNCQRRAGSHAIGPPGF